MARQPHANWLISAEHISGGHPNTVEELDTPAWHGYDVLTHTPAERKWSDALHRRGIRSVPYMNLGYRYSEEFAPGETPDYVLIDQLGRPQLNPNYYRHDGKLVYELCHSAPSAREYHLPRAEAIMKSGADGIFLDNAGPSRKCWGPVFGKHTHIHDADRNGRADGHRPFCHSKAQRRYRFDVPIADEEQTYGSAMLVGEIRRLVRTFGSDKLVLVNGGDGSGMPPIHYEQVDGVMNEMFVFANYLDYNLPVPTHLDFQDHDVMDWLTVLEWQDQFQRRGVRVVDYSSYSPHDPNRKRHSFFAFCVAKLWDQLYYTTADESIDRWLRDIRLGEPLTDHPGSWGAVLYREYDSGLVAVNPYGIAQQANVPWTNKPVSATVHHDGHDLTVRHETLKPNPDGTIVIKLFPDRAALIVPA